MSVTLDADNVLWLRAQASASGKGTVSDLLDRLVTRARQEGHVEPGAIRSVVGTIDLPHDDPGLEAADAYIQDLFTRSAARPMMVRERAPGPAARRKRRG